MTISINQCFWIFLAGALSVAVSTTIPVVLRCRTLTQELEDREEDLQVYELHEKSMEREIRELRELRDGVEPSVTIEEAE
jgi:uncharacterized membrane protein